MKRFLFVAVLATVAIGGALTSHANSSRLVNYDGFLIASPITCANGSLDQAPENCNTEDKDLGRCTVTTEQGPANAVNSNTGSCPGAPLYIQAL